jgi:hypothetical protein
MRPWRAISDASLGKRGNAMKPMIVIAIALMLGLVFGPLATCAHAAAVINHDFNALCRYHSGEGSVVIRDRSPNQNHLEFGFTLSPRAPHITLAPGRPGYGRALSMSAPVEHNINDGLFCNRGDPGFGRACNIRNTRHMTIMAHIKPRGESAVYQGTNHFLTALLHKHSVRQDLPEAGRVSHGIAVRHA